MPRDRAHLRGGLVPALAMTVALAGPAAAQESPEPAIDIDHFEGFEDWPLYRAGDLELENAALGEQRTRFDFRIPTGDTIRMVIDLMEAYHRGQPALWIEWISSGIPGDTSSPGSLDVMLVDRSTFRIAFRIQGTPGPRRWAGSYDLVQHHPDRVVRVSVSDSGTVDTETLERATNPFDFATMGYLFPFIGLEQGRHFRLQNVGSRGSPEPKVVAIRMMGPTTITDATGRTREVHEVQLLSASRRSLVSFWVDEDAPYFYGWTFTSVRDGSTFSRLMYREHTVFHP